MLAINPVTVMTRVLPRTWHVHRGFILSPRPRGALGRHAGLENHLADPESSHSGLCTSLSRNQDKRDRGATGPLDAIPVGVAAQSPRVPTRPLQSRAPGWLLVGPGRPPGDDCHRPRQRDNIQAGIWCRGSVLASTPQDPARVPREVGSIPSLLGHHGMLHTGVAPGGQSCRHGGGATPKAAAGSGAGAEEEGG